MKKFKNIITQSLKRIADFIGSSLKIKPFVTCSKKEIKHLKNLRCFKNIEKNKVNLCSKLKVMY